MREHESTNEPSPNPPLEPIARSLGIEIFSDNGSAA
jgi:hypothetical protein